MRPIAPGLPDDTGKSDDDTSPAHIVELWRARMREGIRATMSIFITNLAFVASPEAGQRPGLATLPTSTGAGRAVFLWLELVGAPAELEPEQAA
jgi:Na+/H+ antiporter NhaA